MNRIILIGNGFDLAHGLKTSYNNFIDDYWLNTIEEIKKTGGGRVFENKEIIIENCPSDNFIKEKTLNDLEKGLNTFGSEIRFKNSFLKQITNKSSLNNWVDIENEYYILLKKSYQDESSNSNKLNITKLNFDFNQIKKLLKDYLIKIEHNFFKEKDDRELLRTQEDISNKIYSTFNYRDFSEDSLNNRAKIEYDSLKKSIISVQGYYDHIKNLDEYEKRIIQIIDKKNPQQEIKELLLSNYSSDYFDLRPNEVMFLNFNYTSIDSIYSSGKRVSFQSDVKHIPTDTIHIHGNLDDTEISSFIFGFGDEIDKDYKSIEELNNNEYLENIKSIQYLESDNYKRLLEFINSEEYQIFIFGHSCGISDRTLLNTLFENDNCSSIKLFYHDKKDGTDNFSDIIRNISRNFNSKVMMRDKVVNKTYCYGLT
ncbi:AbiH family protein [Polaribacter butkevichii]|uniref:Bacteriophage abortive infection AbiH n=1 Tax=Polaribacter butkevichii TaxID=218490 RepID=A0A2P6CDT9_9FLAO|nr:AbiH family protein [Polaribacter butkevichii]PQJ73056.1 hypothetical protein BTO14_07210 [Polaribacter butkevichii]